MIYLKNYNDLILENKEYEYDYVQKINNYIRKNDIKYFENHYISSYRNEYIIIATMYGYTEIVKLLLETFDVNQTNQLNRTAAYYTRNKPEILKLLIDNGLSIEHEDDYDELFFEYVDDDTLEKLKDNIHIKNYFKKQKQKKFNI
jgi:ankyrin repeat protein